MSADVPLHHLNCATLCPHGRRLVTGVGAMLEAGRMVCHCLLVEGADGLVLIDSGFGTGDIANPRQLGRPFNLVVRPQLDRAETAVAQIEALGFDPRDVRHIVVTHLDLDHAGGLPDFPDAEVHVLSAEHAAAMNPTLRERSRYVDGAHWAHGPRWAVHDVGGDSWNGFESVRVLPGSGPEVVLIPLRGHSRGHAGVAVRRPAGWLLHCGDAYFNHGEMRTPPRCPTGLRAFQSLMQADGRARRENQERLRELAARKAGEVELICSHDELELERARSDDQAAVTA